MKNIHQKGRVVTYGEKGHHYSHIQQPEVEGVDSNPRRKSERLVKDINKNYSMMN
jgi:hypothetical protein